MILSRMLPDGTSTSLNSPGSIGASSPLIRRPRDFNPPGRFARVPAVTLAENVEAMRQSAFISAFTRLRHIFATRYL